ncbi:MAG: IS1595 family transposase, partial [Casimicrobiaceae bacterium]
MTANLTKPMFTDPEKAREYLESVRWPRGPICPHCGNVEKITPLKGKSHRAGLYQCNDCREPFSVTVGTLYERSHIPLHKWLLATHLMSASKKGISAHQLHRMLGITYKSAWFMSHRIREAMRPASMTPMGQGGGGVEIDETYIGVDKTKTKSKHGPAHKNRVLSLVDRNSGRAVSMIADNMHAKTLIPILQENIAREATILTDGAPHFQILPLLFAGHQSVDHGRKEYVRMSDRTVHTNTIEGFFSIFKRGMKGTYQHCKEKHLHRYLSEFDFRYSNRVGLGVDDVERTARA